MKLYYRPYWFGEQHALVSDGIIWALLGQVQVCCIHLDTKQRLIATAVISKAYDFDAAYARIRLA